MNVQSQTLRTILIDEVPSAPAETGTWVPTHFHAHSSLSGLQNDDHSIYLTEERAFDFMTDFYTQQGNNVEVESVGGGIEIFLVKDGNCLKFKTLIAGDNITITENTVTHTLTFSATDFPIPYEIELDAQLAPTGYSTLADNADENILVSTGGIGTDWTINLMDVSGAGKRVTVLFEATTGGEVTIVPENGTINGLASVSLTIAGQHAHITRIKSDRWVAILV